MINNLILISDYDDAIRIVIEKKLQRLGLSTKSTNNGEEEPSIK